MYYADKAGKTSVAVTDVPTIPEAGKMPLVEGAQSAYAARPPSSAPTARTSVAAQVAICVARKPLVLQ